MRRNSHSIFRRKTMTNKKNEKIYVVLCEPGKRARITAIENTLRSLQRIVGGDIQAIYPNDDPIAIICNEEDKINGMTLNRALRDADGAVYDILAGTFLIIGLGEENFTTLSEDHREKYRRMFAYPEIFIGVNDGILALQIVEE